MRLSTLAALLALAAALGACSALPEAGEFTFEGGAASGARPDMWPPLPQVPRYAHVGTLHGEENFRRSQAGQTAMRRLLHWVAGIGGDGDQPLTLQRPTAGTTDALGRILVTDASRQSVFVFDTAAGRLDVWDRADGLRRFVSPVGIVAGPNEDTLVADAELGFVARLDRSGEPVGRIGAGTLKRPTGIARDARRGLLYVADTYAHDIKVFDGDGALVEVIGGRGEGPGRFNYPTHLAFAAGALYVTDSMNNRVQVLQPQGAGVERTIGRRGLYVGNLVRPKGVAADRDGNVYVAESFYDMLLVFDAQGRFLMPIGSAGGPGGRFYLPSGIWTDDGDRVYVADMFNGRVVVFEFLGGD
ncbi:MAG: 6-bladed beta-propeller [Burkholderiales bacterium]|nr:MAG: 6-bladed beta-propeller [Burkholderiales bacterium]